jgi:hypothetical protein
MQRINKNFLTAVSGITLAAFMALHAGPGRAGEGGDETAGGVPAGQQKAAGQAPVAAQGLRVYRDPQTGRLGPPPPGVVPPGLTAAEQRMLNRSDQGLQVHTLPGGGVAVDLQGRYRSMAVATVSAGGQAAVNCALTPAQAAAALRGEQQAVAGPAD